MDLTPIRKTRRGYMLDEYNSGRIFPRRKAMVKHCLNCGGWIDSCSLGSIIQTDLPEYLENVSLVELQNMWVNIPYCVACCG